MKASDIELPIGLLKEALRHLEIISDHPKTDHLVTRIQDYFDEERDNKCEGACVRHIGKARDVYLSSEDGEYDNHPFTYCELAIMTDEESGYFISE